MVDRRSNEPLSHDLALPAGARLFEFEIESVMGYGSFGITYRATDTLLRQAVAIKEYLPNQIAVRSPQGTVRVTADENQEEFKTGLAAFLEEARVMALFNDDHIVHVRRYFETNGTGYIVLNSEPGRTLSDIVRDAPLPEAEFRGIFSAILDGVEVIHNRGILHHGLEPDNIMLRHDGSAVIVGFGAAGDLRSRHGRGVAAASPYWPPERRGATGQQGPWSDLYALGAIAYRCITGSAPPAAPERLRHDDPFVPAVVAASRTYNKALLSAVDWMLRVEERDRPRSVADVRLALRTGIVPPALPTGGGFDLAHDLEQDFERDLQRGLEQGLGQGLEQALKRIVTAEFGERRSARRGGALKAAALLFLGTIVLSAGGLAVLKAESISEIACGRFGTLCTSWQTAVLEAAACFNETDACKASSCTTAFTSKFPSDVVPARLANLESAARETCRRAPEDAFNAAKTCAARFAGSAAASCDVVDCYQDYLVRFPDGRGAGEAKEAMRKANAACLEPRIFNQAVACSIANPCKAEACFGGHRAVYLNSALRPQADFVITRAAGSCVSTERDPAAAPHVNPGGSP